MLFSTLAANDGGADVSILEVVNLTIQNGGSINANDDWAGSIPNSSAQPPIVIQATGNVIIEADTAGALDTGIFAENRAAGGNGANITLDVNGTFTMQAGATVTSSKTAGAGDTGVAGNIEIDVDLDVDLQVGAVIKANGTGPAGDIDLTVGGTFTMQGTATPLAGALISSVGGSGNGGDITIGVAGDVLTETGTKVLSDGRSGGAIYIHGENVDIDGTVSSHGTITGVSNQPPGGGTVTVIAHDVLTISDTGVVSSSGFDPGADLVHLEGCHVFIYGLVESTGQGHVLPVNPPNHLNDHANHPAGSTAGVEIWADDLLVIDSTGTHNGEVKADLSIGADKRSWIDLFASREIVIIGDTTGPFAVHATNGGNGPTGGQISVISLLGTITASGLAFDATATGTGFPTGGVISMQASGTVDLDTASIFARGDFNAAGGYGSGGTLAVRSFNGAVSWENGVADVRPTGIDASPALNNPGTITLTYNTSISTLNTQFLTGGVTPLPPNVPFPTIVQNTTGGSPSLPDYVILPECEEDPVGSISWEKRDQTNALQGGATFSVVNAGNTFDLTVIDNGANDADPDAGQIQVINIPFGVYTVTETVAPAGYALDDDANRTVTVSALDTDAVIGSLLGSPPGTDDPGNTDESDFHNRLGSLAWEKRTDVSPFPLQGGATFEVDFDNASGFATITVVDNGLNDADGVAGQILVLNVPLGTHTITETVAPAGYALDDDPTRTVTVTSAALAQVIGTQGVNDPGNTDESDFHNRLGSLAWEKRTDVSPFPLQGGATFEVDFDNASGFATITVVDNGLNDADGVAGQILVLNVPLGTHTITETVAPAGYALDDDPTRTVIVTTAALAQVIGTQGVDDPGNTDESDFHNRLGSLAWEKRTDVSPFPLQGGATFEVDFDNASGFATITVVDNGLNDADGVAGQILVLNVPLGTHTITETVAPAGYALDDDPTRTVIGTSAALAQVIGTQGVDDPGNTDESDFHNPLLQQFGSLAWEKRDDCGILLGGATFTVSPNPLTGSGTPLTVVDNGANDADPALGKIKVNNVLFGTYTITETLAPAGYALDADPTRVQTVDANNLNAVVGTQGVDNPGTTDESDFHNKKLPLGSLSWEKRDDCGILLGGATFTVGPNNPLTGSGTPLTVVDNGANDADPTAGRIKVNNVLLGTYTITETVAPAGYALDADPTRVQTVSSSNLNAVIGTQGYDNSGTTDESDFHNKKLPLGSLSWEKRDDCGILLGGAMFTVGPNNPLTGSGTPLTVVDNGANDADPTAGKIKVNNVLFGTYTITETVAPAGYALDADPTRVQTVSSSNLNAVVGTQGYDNYGTTDESDFHNKPLPKPPVVVCSTARCDLKADAFRPGKTALCIGGTSATDCITVTCYNGKIRVNINGKVWGDYSVSGGIYIQGFDGNDTITVDKSVTHDVMIWGGKGDDCLTGGSGCDVLLGEEGNDKLYGGWSGNDMLLGGTGCDSLWGSDSYNKAPSSDNNLLIGDSVSYEKQVDKIFAIYDQWRTVTKTTCAATVTALKNPASGLALLCGTSVTDDKQADKIYGGQGLDWYFQTLGGYSGDTSDWKTGKYRN
ncbi:MAG: hypothetical protein K8T91_24335 [Planctomycetes bacterium]|nr:hypothetical protein [Planctomycetota bacterium]